MHIKAQRDDFIQSEFRAGGINRVVEIITNLLPVSEGEAMFILVSNQVE